MTVCCPWCGRPFKPRATGGSDQRFCRAACRTAFWSAARRWVLRAFQTGLLSADVLKAAQAVPTGFRAKGIRETLRLPITSP
jgi:hypothetical protein